MGFVESVSPRNSRGKSCGIDDLDSIETVDVSFTCPVCTASQNRQEVRYTEQAEHTCSECVSQYHLFPLVANDGSDIGKMTILEQVDEQLRAVEVGYHMTDRTPRLATSVVGLPSTFLYGIPPAILGSISLGVLGVSIQSMSETATLLIIVYSLSVLAYAAGLAFVLFDAYGSTLKMKDYLQRNNHDVGIPFLIRAIGNCTRLTPYGYAFKWWRRSRY